LRRHNLSIIVPVLNEAQDVAAALLALRGLRQRGAELIVVDGGSTDGTVAEAAPLADQMLSAARGRASQMNAGAAVARGDILLFLHADTRLPEHADALIPAALGSGKVWGRFDVLIAGRSPWLPLVATMMNWRSRLTGMATGDQAMFVSRATFLAAGGFPAIALMEDIALSRCLRRLTRPACIGERAITSGRRWEARGVWRTVWLMWRLRLRYFLGADPDKLAVAYGHAPRGQRESRPGA
jgi:rSAM/selenodomain-associated transferase 2